MESSKIALYAGALVVIAGVSWYVLASPNTPQVAQTPTQQPIATQPTQQVTPEVTEPTKTSSSDQIIDYLVDDVTKAETAEAKASIDSQAPTSQADAASAINTNF
jgi:hypothetical protein